MSVHRFMLFSHVSQWCLHVLSCLQDVLQAWKPWKCRTKASSEEKQRNLGAEIDLESGPSTMPNQSTEGRLNGHPTPAIVSPD